MRSVLALALAVLMLPAIFSPASATVLSNDCFHLVTGVLNEDEKDRTRGATFDDCICADVLRDAHVMVSFVPQTPSDAVHVEVTFTNSVQVALLTAGNPTASFMGVAPDSCITDVVVGGVSVGMTWVSYTVTDA